MSSRMFLLLAPCLIFLAACGGQTAPPVKVDQIKASKVLFTDLLNISGRAAWLGEATKGQKIFLQPAKEQTVVTYLSGDDLTLVAAGQQPKQPLLVSTQKSTKKSQMMIFKSLRSEKIIKTPLGPAMIVADGRKAYLSPSGALVVVEVPDSLQMRTTLMKLNWFDGGSN